MNRSTLRSILQINMKTILWLVVVVAVTLGWYRDRSQLATRIHDLETKFGPQVSTWSIADALGKPDEPTGSGANAWCPATEDGQREWLELTYSHGVRPAKILIHETYATGAVDRVSVFDWWDREIVVWSGKDPTPPGQKGLLSIPVKQSLNTRRVKVYLDSANVAGWNCIDAVGLQSHSGKRYWAKSAKASSSYGARYQGSFRNGSRGGYGSGRYQSVY